MKAQADYDEMQARWKRGRISELAKEDVATLAEFGADLESILHAKTDRIEELEGENAELRDLLNNRDAAQTEMASTIEYLSEIINLAEEDSRRAELVGREPDEGLRLVIARQTDRLIGLFHGDLQ